MAEDNKASLTFKLISSKELLNDVTFFLEKGFHWKKEITYALQKRLIYTNKDLGSYGVVMFDRNKIIGAILFFYQGSFIINGSNINSVNMSCWYVDESYRGSATISLARFMLQKLENYTVTNYSANDTAHKILTLLGFREMKLKRLSNRLDKSFFSLFSSIPLDIKDKNIDKYDFKNEFKLKSSAGIKLISIKHKSFNLKIILKQSYIKIKFLGIPLRFKTQTIIWASNYKNLAKHWMKYSLGIIFSTKSFKITADIPDKININERYLSRNNYLMYGSLKIDHVMPVNSEMDIFN